jgi:predicted  nucleic acid-binding Zn-ribbon protein
MSAPSDTGRRAPDKSPGSGRARRANAATLKAEIETLQAKIAELEARVADRRSDFRATSERDRAEGLLAELLRMTAELMSAREASARLEDELNALRAQRHSRPWWWRLVAG